MDFEFSPEQEMLRESVRAFLAAKAPMSYVREMADDAPVWEGLADLGVLGLLLPEASGGAGMGMVDIAVVLEELGRALCPAPYMSCAVGAMPLLVDLGDELLLEPVGGGSIVGTVAIFEEGARYAWQEPETKAIPESDDNWRLTGVKVHVPDCDAADVFLVTARDPDGVLGVFATRSETAGVRASRSSNVDITRRDGRLEIDGAISVRIGGDATDAIARTLDRLGVAAVVDGVGAAQRAMELAVEYAKERVQFDKPIGSFQAIQHLCADMLRTVELGRAAAYYACWAIDDASPEEAHRAATLARAFGADAFPQLGGTAIQVFGGIGFTWEHDIHLYYKRLLSQSVALGTATDHLEELAHLAID